MSRDPSEPDYRALGRLTAILSKQPRPGFVKTRLCPPLGALQAAELARAMLLDAIERCCAASEAGCFQVSLWFAPEEARSWFEAAAPGLALHAQRGPGLAERLGHAFEEGLAQPGVESMVAMGSDQPLLGRGRLVAAHQALEAGSDVVLGPDAGGGYYLIGMRQPQLALFDSITMSTPGMCQETLSLAESLGLRVTLLEGGYDVDLEADLKRLIQDLEAWQDSSDPDFPRHSQDFIKNLPLPLARLLTHG